MEGLAEKKLREGIEKLSELTEKGHLDTGALEQYVEMLVLAREWGLPQTPRPDFMEFLAEYLLAQVDPDKAEESEEFTTGYMTALEQVKDAWETYSKAGEED